MAIFPGAIVKLIPRHNKVKIARYRRMNLHVAVSNGDSLFGYFSGAEVCSHFYVRDDGTVEQYIDTKYMSKADLDGNDSTISVETEGGVTNANKEEWTGPQIRSLAALWKWARDTHKIKNQIAKNTLTNDNSSGLSWHRLGVEGNFKGRPGLASISYGGIRYSKAKGKECPGDAKINQIPEIFALANGNTSPPVIKPTAPSKPKPPVTAGKSWPKAKLLVDGDFGKLSVKALQTMLKGHPNKSVRYTGLVDGSMGSMTVKSVQRWLKWLGKYDGLIDGSFGPMTVKALQKFLKAKGHLDEKKWLTDGVFGSETKKAFQRYINSQSSAYNK